MLGKLDIVARKQKKWEHQLRMLEAKAGVLHEGKALEGLRSLNEFMKRRLTHVPRGELDLRPLRTYINYSLRRQAGMKGKPIVSMHKPVLTFADVMPKTASARTIIKRKLQEFNRRGRLLGESEIIEGVREMHERLGEQAFMARYGTGFPGLDLLTRDIIALRREPGLIVALTKNGIIVAPPSLGSDAAIKALKSRKVRG
jgi:hypothetical protein